MGRPRKEQHEARDVRLNLRLLADEYVQIEERASLFGITPTEYARRLATGGHVPVRTVERADAALVVALNRIGVNLNQIARTMNSDPGHVSLDLAETLERITKLVDRLKFNET